MGESASNIKANILNGICIILGLAGLLCFIAEMIVVKNISFEWVFICALFVVGFLFEFLLGKIVDKVFPNFKYRDTKKGSYAFLFFTIGIPFFFVAFGSYYNREYYTNSICTKDTIIAKLKYRQSRSDHYYFRLKNNGVPVELEVTQDDWERILVNAKVEVCRAKGGLGFDVTNVYFR